MMNKTVSRTVSLMLTLCMILGMVYLPSDVFAVSAEEYGNFVVLEEDFEDVTDWTLQSGITHFDPSTIGQHVKLTNSSDKTSAYYDYNPEDCSDGSGLLATTGKPSNMTITFNAKANGARLNVTSCMGLYGGGADRYYTVRFYDGKIYNGNDAQIGTLPTGFDIAAWHTYQLRWFTGGGYFLELSIDGAVISIDDGTSTGNNRVAGKTGSTDNRLQFFADYAAGTVEIDDVKVVDIAVGNTTKLNCSFNPGTENPFVGNYSTGCNAELVASETLSNTTGFLRLTRTSATGKTIYANSPTYTEVPENQKVDISFDADLTGGGEVGFLFDSILNVSGTKAIRRLYFSLRPATANNPAGFYKRSGEGSVKIDLTDVNIAGWHTYSFTVDPVAETAEVFVDGTKVGTLALEAVSYLSDGNPRPTATHAQFMMLNLDNTGETMIGYADVDNLSINYTVLGPAPEFAASAALTISDTIFDGFTASWPAAENATSYDVYLDGVKQASVTTTSYTFTGLAEKAEGYDVKVVAISKYNPDETDELSIAAWVGSAGEEENFESVFGEKVLYDDYIDLSKAPFSIGNQLVGLSDQIVTSTAVGTSEKDANVLVWDAATTTLHAVGVGTAKLRIGDTVYNVRVEPAPISLFMITGHSQGAGSKGDATQSIVCEQGQVYSSHESEAVRNVRDFLTAGTLNPAEQTLTLHSAAELATMGIGTAAASRPIGIDALTAAGNGTPAADSGFAYQWNKLTGEKVWILNCAVGGSNQDFWMPDQEEFWAEYNADPNNIPRDQLDLSVNAQHYINMYGTMYQHSVDLFRAAQTVLANEIAAGHFTLSHMGLLNFTGANGDEWIDPAEGTAKFNKMWAAYVEDLAMDMDGDSETETVESIGVMPLYHLRSMENQAPSDFLNYTKAVNHHMAASNDYPHVYLTALDHRQWLTSENIAAYFADYDLSYTIQSGNAITRPTTIHDIFPTAKNDVVHYQQIAYNTLGQEMAKRTKMYFAGEKGADTLQLITACQTPGAAEVLDLTTLSPIKLSLGQEYKFGILAAPGGLTVEATGAISLDKNEMGTIKAATEDGIGTLTVKDGDTVLETVTFYVGNVACEHTETTTTKENEVAATCTTDGSYVSIVKCSACGEEISRETVTVSALSHAVNTTFAGLECCYCAICDNYFLADGTTSILTFTISDGKAAITDCNKSVSGALEIPATLGGCPVTTVGHSAFSWCANLTSITIPDNVITIDQYAFGNCDGLTSITIPNSVTIIGKQAFEGCGSLASVTIGSGVTAIGDSAFRFCTRLTSITIPN